MSEVVTGKPRAFVLSEIRETTHAVPVVIPPTALNMIGQVRKTYSGIPELARSIAAHGQQTPGDVPTYTPEEAQHHLDLFNRVFHSNHTLADLTAVALAERADQAMRPYYCLLSTGHRRCLAVKEIERLQAQDPLFVPGPLYAGGYRALFHFGMSPERALKMQFNENRHDAVPAAEEARAAWDYYCVMRELHHGYAEAELASDIGRTSDWVRGALRFCRLPESIQGFVDGSRGMQPVSYGRMVEIARLADGYREIVGRPLGEDVLLKWILDAVLERLSSENLAKRVSTYLERKAMEHEGQGALFEEEKSPNAAKKHARQVAAQSLVLGILQMLGYLEEIRRLMDAGVLGTADNPFAPELDSLVHDRYSSTSPARMAARFAERLQGMTPKLQQLAAQSRSRLSPQERQLIADMPAILASTSAAAQEVVRLEGAF